MELVARKPEPFDLQRERVNRGLSRLGLQQKTGVHRDSIRRFEEGTVRPRAATAKKLADYFGITAAELLGLDDDKDAA
jgi:ribosome-binding protein aMBF1 (putative translation factor)